MTEKQRVTQDGRGKLPYAHPQLVQLGSLKEVVLGGGKTGSNSDSDPQSTRKAGTG